MSTVSAPPGALRRAASRRSTRLLTAAALCLVGLLALPALAGASLQINVQQTGKVSYSADGLGQFGTGGTIQAEVPTGATVERAFLYGTYFFSDEPSEESRTINFDGTDVVTQLTPTQIGANCCGLSTTRAEVTNQVKAKVGTPALPGGVYDFVIGNDPGDLDGVALVVIYSHPSLPDGTVAILDGGATPAGDTATLDFFSPIDLTQPGFQARMSVGSGFSFQGSAGNVCGGGQFSIIDVNSQRLTSCAGNFDDGGPGNGALITVGGVGDSIDNPANPNSSNSGTDDELYNLVPFLKQGDTQLKIDSSNPSADDNFFLAVIGITAEARVTTEVCDDGVDNDGDGKVDQEDPDCAPPPSRGRMVGKGSQGANHWAFTTTCQNAAASRNPWQLRDGSNRYRLTNITSRACTDDPAITPADPSMAFDTIVYEGTGTKNGAPGYKFEVIAKDGGSGGANDTTSIVIKTPSDVTEKSISGTPGPFPGSTQPLGRNTATR
jgi:hypothetical protein